MPHWQLRRPRTGVESSSLEWSLRSSYYWPRSGHGGPGGADEMRRQQVGPTREVARVAGRKGRSMRRATMCRVSTLSRWSTHRIYKASHQQTRSPNPAADSLQSGAVGLRTPCGPMTQRRMPWPQTGRPSFGRSLSHRSAGHLRTRSRRKTRSTTLPTPSKAGLRVAGSGVRTPSRGLPRPGCPRS